MNGVDLGGIKTKLIMSKIFIERKEATRHAVKAGETLAGFLARMKAENACEADLTWEELAIYNWATTEAREVKRALIELVGCPQIVTNSKGRAQIDNTDPENTVLDQTFGLEKKGILVPKAWQKKGLELEKTHKVKIRKRLPAPAIAITRLSQWFIPESKDFEGEFATEGVKARADKVDFEVQATSYFERNSGGELIPSTPHKDILRWEVINETKTSEGVISPMDSWRGESEATSGILTKGSEDCYINFACAPYTVLKRYYKDDGDGDAKINLDAFYPCWHRATDGSGSLVLDDKSLIVKWTVKKDNSKLKVGQLIIWNQYDEPVFRAALSETKLREGKYDLLHESVSWDKAKIFQDLMPYRVQIQAHSDMDQENGLALAVMHTEVRAFKYDWIQFIAFDIKPGTKDDGSGKMIYLGDSDDDTDIETRCDIMKEAIRTAYRHGDIDDDTSVLKVFMAPEFYFRGAKGSYPIEKISGIVDSMRETTDRFELADWLFVFGTAIGQLAHEEVTDTGAGTGQERVHSGDVKYNARIVEVDNSGPTRIKVECGLAPGLIGNLVPWGAKQTIVNEITKCELSSESPGKNQFWLTLRNKSLFTPGPVVLLEPVAAILDGKGKKNKWSLKVKSKICSRIVKGVDWKIRQAGTEGTIDDCTHIANDVYQLSVISTGDPWKIGWVKLVEPIATEIFNIALVQKGWPAPSPCDKGLRGAIVYKEYVSHIDFIRDKTKYPSWDLKDRRITIDEKAERRVLPTSGSRDVGGAEPNVPGEGSTWTDKDGIEHTVGSEINKSGVGGGSVFTIDDITFGLEVCLDHGKDKLHNFYDGQAASGDPKVQIHLIPSWGIEIGGGEVCCVDDGLVFNVDGSRCNSIARVNDGKWSCDDHEDVVQDSGGNCPTSIYKAPCHGYQHISPFTCPKCPTTATLQPPHALKPIGTAVELLGDAEDVPSSNDANYFEKAGKIKVYEVQEIPDPEFV